MSNHPNQASRVVSADERKRINSPSTASASKLFDPETVDKHVKSPAISLSTRPFKTEADYERPHDKPYQPSRLRTYACGYVDGVAQAFGLDVTAGGLVQRLPVHRRTDAFSTMKDFPDVFELDLIQANKRSST